MAVDGTVQEALNGGHFPCPTDQIRLNAPDRPMPDHAQQPVCEYTLFGTFDLNQLRLAKS